MVSKDVSSGNVWERRSQRYFDSGNGVQYQLYVNCTKKHPACTKIRLFKIQSRNFPPRPFPVRKGTPLPTLHPPRRAQTARRIRRLIPSSPHLLILEPPLFGSHTSFIRKRSLMVRNNGRSPNWVVIIILFYR